MNIVIKNKDLPIWLDFLSTSKIIDVSDGTVTAFTNSILGSVLIPQMDDTFEFALRFIGNKFDRSRNLKRESPAYDFFDQVYKKENREARILVSSFDPMYCFDEEDAPSYEAMKNAIKWVCNLYNINDDASFYKSPYALYAKFQDDNKIDNYIKEILYPNFIEAMKIRDIIVDIQKKIDSQEDYELKSFFPEKCSNLFTSYLHTLNVSTFIYLHSAYFPHYDYLNEDNLQYEIENESDRIAFFDYTIKLYGIDKVLNTYGLDKNFQTSHEKFYTRVENNHQNNCNAICSLKDKYLIENMMPEVKSGNKVKV